MIFYRDKIRIPWGDSYVKSRFLTQLVQSFFFNFLFCLTYKVLLVFHQIILSCLTDFTTATTHNLEVSFRGVIDFIHVPFPFWSNRGYSFFSIDVKSLSSPLGLFMIWVADDIVANDKYIDCFPHGVSQGRFGKGDSFLIIADSTRHLSGLIK